MDKFYGPVGFVKTVEVYDGEWDDAATEGDYYGDIIKRSFRAESNANRNDDIKLSNQISIIADKFAMQNLGCINYVVWNGISWKVTNVELRYPRILLTLGGVYNGERPQSDTEG